MPEIRKVELNQGANDLLRDAFVIGHNSRTICPETYFSVYEITLTLRGEDVLKMILCPKTKDGSHCLEPNKANCPQISNQNTILVPIEANPFVILEQIVRDYKNGIEGINFEEMSPEEAQQIIKAKIQKIIASNQFLSELRELSEPKTPDQHERTPLLEGFKTALKWWLRPFITNKAKF